MNDDGSEQVDVKIEAGTGEAMAEGMQADVSASVHIVAGIGGAGGEGKQ
jgi:hypothetical protein